MLYVIDNNKMGFETCHWFVETDVDESVLNKILSLPEEPHSIVFCTENVKWIDGAPTSLEEYVSDFEFYGKELEIVEISEINIAARKNILKEAIEEMRRDIDNFRETITEYVLEEQEEIEKQIEAMADKVETYEVRLKTL